MEVSPEGSPHTSSGWSGVLNKAYRYRRLLKRRWWILLLTMSVGLGSAAWWVSFQPPRFSSVGRMMVSGKVNIPEGAIYSEELNNFYGTQIQLMQSGEVRRRAQERIQSLRPDLVPERIVIEAMQLRGAAIFILKATGENPDYTQLYVDSTMEEYINSKKEMRSDKSESTLTAISGELVRLEKELRAGEAEMLGFQKLNNVGFLQEAGNSAATYAVTLNRQLANLRTEFDLLKLLDLDQTLDRVQKKVGSSRVDLQACKLEYSIVSPK